MPGAYNLRFDDGVHWRVAVEEVDRFRNTCLEAEPAIRAFANRIGRCFWFDLLALTERYRVAAHDVLLPLLQLECGEPAMGLKLATPFTRAPLKGLWHKHWFSPRFLPANIVAVTQRKGSMDWIWEIAQEGDVLTEELISQIAHRMTIGAFESRHAAKQLTGEWIIFLPRDGLNYYLCLGTHRIGDDRLDDKIRTVCSLDFPEIAQWIDAVILNPCDGVAP